MYCIVTMQIVEKIFSLSNDCRIVLINNVALQTFCIKLISSEICFFCHFFNIPLLQKKDVTRKMVSLKFFEIIQRKDRK